MRDIPWLPRRHKAPIPPGQPLPPPRAQPTPPPRAGQPGWRDQLRKPLPPGVPFDPDAPGNLPLPTTTPTYQPGPLPGLPPLPTPATTAPEPSRPKLQLSRGWMAIITAVGMFLTVLMLIDGWGLVTSGTLRDWIAVIIAGLTPLVVYFLPSWKPPTTTKETPDAKT